jgi:tRNA A58 N-methylase Trm61
MTALARRFHALAAAVVALWCCGAILRGQAPNDPADANRLVQLLAIHDGSIVAEIGAGSGPLTIAVARIVGSTGTVYSNDVNLDRLKEIREAAAKSELRNVVIVHGAPARTNLPEECCDAIFMRDVYHHFGDPAAMNASLRASLKPGGRLAVVDFAPDSGVTASPGRRDTGASHGITVDTLIQELKSAGFIDVREGPWSSPGYFVVAGQRPQ